MEEHGRDEPYSKREALEFLFSGSRRGAVLADALDRDYTSLAAALDDLRIDHLSMETRILVAAARDIATSRLIRELSDHRMQVRTPVDAGEFFIGWFKGMEREEMAAMYLDERCCVLDVVSEAQGTQYAVPLDVRSILRRAETLGASGVIIAHNHPHAPLLPSRADLEGTTVITWSARAMGCELLDHIIVSDNDFVSLYESGLLSTDRRMADATLEISGGELKGELGG